MTHSQIEARLRDEMGRQPSGRPDPNALADIRRRVGQEREWVRLENVGRRRRQMAYIAALTLVSVGVLSQVNNLLDQERADLADSTSQTIDIAGPVSWWWLALVGASCAAIVARLHLAMRDRLATAGLILAVSAGLGAGSMLIESANTATELASQAPPIDSYELVDADWSWPMAQEETALVVLRYEAVVDDANSSNDVVELFNQRTLLLQSGFDKIYADNLCRLVDDRNEDRVNWYCLAAKSVTASGDVLTIQGSVASPPNPIWTLGLLAVAGFGAALAIGVGVEHNRGARSDTRRRAFTVVLLLTGTSLVLMAVTSALLVRVSDAFEAPYYGECPGGLRQTAAAVESIQGGPRTEAWEAQLSSCMENYTLLIAKGGVYPWSQIATIEILLLLDAIAAGLVIVAFYVAKKGRLSRDQLHVLAVIVGFGVFVSLVQLANIETIVEITRFYQ